MLKRAFDFIAATVLLIILAPIMVIIAVAVIWFLGFPIFFRQPRPGLHGKPFRVIKFRTMLEATGRDGMPLPDSMRLGYFGMCLRRLSLDELPQLFNVLVGNMSLVGPRPLLLEYLPLYTQEQMRRHEVRPGITGWAQINGRNLLTWEEKFALDNWYVDHQSFWLDLNILLATAARVFSGTGVAKEGSVTTDKFRGTKQAMESMSNEQ